MLDFLQTNVLQPLAAELFPSAGSSFDSHHSFIVRYQQDQDLGLDMYTLSTLTFASKIHALLFVTLGSFAPVGSQLFTFPTNVRHTDDSDVTFNVCLGREFTGAALTFCGALGSAHHRQFSCEYKHVKGQCVIHLGRRRHGAGAIGSGERVNLIIWNRSITYRSSR